MTKADITTRIADETGVEKLIVSSILESFMTNVRESLTDGKHVYLRGFGSFIVKKRAKKVGRIISKNIAISIPEHFIPAFKPAKTFSAMIKTSVKAKAKSKNKKK